MEKYMNTVRNLVALVGPSGSGKTAVLDYLTTFHGNIFAIPKAITTRQKRMGENDCEYVFTSHDIFQEQIKAGNMLEHSTYAGELYGVRKQEVESIIRAGKIPIRAMDFPGSQKAGAYTIFIDRATDDLLECILQRKCEDKDIVRRLRQLPDERANKSKCDARLTNDTTVEALGMKVMAELSWMINDNPRPIVLDATFVSYWDGGSECVETRCKVNLITREVFDIQQVSDPEALGLEVLDRECIRLFGKEFDACQKDELNPDDENLFWYN